MVSTSESERPAERLLKSTSVVGSMTLLSRITGLARDVVLSHWFGAGIVMDAFFVAFRIPNLLRRFFAEGAFSQAFVPVVSEYRATRSEEDVRELLDRVTGTLGAIVLGISVIGVLVAPLLIIIFAPGFLADRDRAALATDMLRLTFPYLLFISLTALAGGILNTYRRFAVPAFTPVLLNLVLILFAVVVAPHLPRPAMALALGVLAAGVAQLAFQLPFLRRLHLLPRPRWDLAHAGVRKIIRLMLPVLFGSSVAQINILFDTLIASFLAAGSISWLYYSDRLMEFPLGVFGIALATVILPSLSEHHVKNSAEEFSATLDWALRYVLLIGLPAAIGLIVLAEPLITTIYGGGASAFTPRDAAMAEASLRAFAPGLLGFVLVKVLSPGYFARQDTRTPVRIGVAALLLNMVLNVVFVLVLLKSGWAPPHAGVAAATSASGIFNASMLLAGLHKTGIYKRGPGWGRLGVQVLAGCIAMTLYVLWVLGRFGNWQALGIAERVGALVLAVGGAILVYFGVCWLFGLRPAALHRAYSGGGQ